MAKVLEAKLIISGEDRTAKVFAEIEARAKRLEGHFKGINRMVGGGGGLGSLLSGGASNNHFRRLEQTQATLARSIDKMERSVRSLGRSSIARAAGGHHGGIGVGHLAGFGGGFAAAEALHEAARASIDRVHESARMRMSGMSAAEVSRATVDAAMLSARTPVIGQTEAMHQIRNTRSVVGSLDEATTIMPDLMKLRVIAQAARPHADVSEDFDQLIKGLEIKGVTQNPKQFKEYIEGISKGLQVFGDTLKPFQYYEMFKYGRQATPGLSEKFILSTAPTLAQELGGSSYGNAVSGFNRSIVGGRMEHASLKEMARLGLVAKGDLDYLKSGEVKGLKPGRGIQGWQLAQSDPNEWVRKYLLPALNDHGIIDGSKIMKEIGVLFSNRTAAQMVSLLATQQSRIDKDAGLIHGAMGLGGADYIMRNDPELSSRALKESISSLAGTLGADIAKALSPVMADTASAIARLNAVLTWNNAQKNAHPDQDSPLTKRSRRTFNLGVYGIDTDEVPTDDQKQDALFEKRRAQIVGLRDMVDKDAETRWRKEHEKRGAGPMVRGGAHKPLDPNSFEGRQLRRMEEEEVHPFQLGATQQLSELDAAHKAKVEARQRLAAFNEHGRRLRLMGTRMYGGALPGDLGGDPTETPMMVGMGLGARGGYRGLDAGGAPKHFGPFLPAGGLPAAPSARAPDLSALLSAANNTKSALDSVNSTKVAPVVDDSGLDGAITKARELAAALTSIGSQAKGVGAAVRGINATPLNLGSGAPGTSPAGRTPSGK